MNSIQRKVFEFVASRVRCDLAPTDQAIRLRFGLRSNEESAAILDALEDQGYILISGSKLARKIVVLRYPAPKDDAEASIAIAPTPSAPIEQPTPPPLVEDASPKATDHHPWLVDGSELLSEISAFIARNHVSKSRFGTLAMGDKKFVMNLSDGRKVTPATATKVREFMRENDGLITPSVTGRSRSTAAPPQNEGFTNAPVDVLISLIERWSETDGPPAVIAFDLACAALERFEGDVARNGKPRVSAKIIRASVEAGKPLHEFCTELMDDGFALWSAGR